MLRIDDLFHSPTRPDDGLDAARRKARLIETAVAMLRHHHDMINADLGAAALPWHDDEGVLIEGSTRGLKTYPEMEAAVYMTVAQMEIAASEAADMIRQNIATLRKYKDHETLFPDWATLCQWTATANLKFIAAGRAAAARSRAAALPHAAAA